MSKVWTPNKSRTLRALSLAGVGLVLAACGATNEGGNSGDVQLRTASWQVGVDCPEDTVLTLGPIHKIDDARTTVTGLCVNSEGKSVRPDAASATGETRNGDYIDITTQYTGNVPWIGGVATTNNAATFTILYPQTEVTAIVHTAQGATPAATS